jgi:hypothetical protein
MKKIKNLFERVDGKIINKIRPSSQWVADGEGIATAKFDGTCCLIKDGKLYARYDLKPVKGKGPKYEAGILIKFCIREDFKTPPEGFIECDDSDMYLGHIMGWVPVEGNEKFYPYHVNAYDRYDGMRELLRDGTYELVGPKIQGNPHQLTNLALFKHGDHILTFEDTPPRDFYKLRSYLFHKDFQWEGIVWHRENGDMVKIRVRDFKNLTDE